MNKNIPLVIAGFVFSLVTIAHLIRIVTSSPIIIAGHVLPMSVSYVGLVISLLLAVWMFKASS